MAKTKRAVKADEIAEVAEAVIEQKVEVKHSNNGLMKFKVLVPVLGYKAGDTFEASFDSVKRQIKHKSIEVA